jgi:D-glycero-D-manno-heptose 1,7-bisphosphate phosphatase
VFVDRDGTLNHAIIQGARSFPPRTVAEFRLFPGVAESLSALKAAGFFLVVVTNQPDVGAGRQTREVVEAMHVRLRELVPIDDVRVCYHTDADACACRKPQPGMLFAAAADLGLDLAGSYMIGDRWRDVGAGRAAGCRTIFIRNSYDERQPDDYHLAVRSLTEASDAILNSRV